MKIFNLVIMMIFACTHAHASYKSDTLVNEQENALKSFINSQTAKKESGCHDSMAKVNKIMKTLTNENSDLKSMYEDGINSHDREQSVIQNSQTKECECCKQRCQHKLVDKSLSNQDLKEMIAIVREKGIKEIDLAKRKDAELIDSVIEEIGSMTAKTKE